DLPREQLLARIARAADAVDAALGDLDPEQLGKDWPGGVVHGRVNTGRLLVHLTAHCAYHLGQVDYHRRLVAGDATGVEAQSMREILGDPGAV
ncbi:MAG: hypothetical protein RQ751_09755, partial [Longimicrobiales bacterium]|nr:hypothetical protein [Longimicrobiales bacterium]